MRLIVNADDFGITEAVSRGILAGMKEGFITDTSVLVNSPYFASSMELAKEAGVTEMGVHLTITFLKPVLGTSKVSSVVDDHGDFYRKPHLIPSAYRIGEVRDELRAQIEKYLRTGLTLNHLDTHHGFSIIDLPMFDLLIELAQEYNVPMRRDDILVRGNDFSERLAVSGVRATDKLYVDLSVPYVRKEMVREALEAYKDTDDVVEIAGHPGHVDEALRGISSLVDAREQDLQLFMNPELMEYIQHHNIELISYGRL